MDKLSVHLFSPSPSYRGGLSSILKAQNTGRLLFSLRCKAAYAAILNYRKDGR